MFTVLNICFKNVYTHFTAGSWTIFSFFLFYVMKDMKCTLYANFRVYLHYTVKVMKNEQALENHQFVAENKGKNANRVKLSKSSH